MSEDKIRANAASRCRKDIEMYQKEIEDLKNEIRSEKDEYKLKHLNKLLTESQRTLSSLLLKVQEYEE